MTDDKNKKPGPARRAPAYHAGETFGTKPARTPSGVKVRVARAIQYPDVERHPNGAVPGRRDKAARRVIRAALKRRFSRVEKALALPRAMLAQAVEVVKEAAPDASPSAHLRRAKQLFAQELAIHQPVYAPDKKTLRKMRTEKRKLKRKGGKDAIAKLVDRMASKP